SSFRASAALHSGAAAAGRSGGARRRSAGESPGGQYRAVPGVLPARASSGQPPRLGHAHRVRAHRAQWHPV
nr:hypothetical protein [Tanacetum cinerariifolium]